MPLRDVPIHKLNEMVMATEDVKVLQAWLEEEKADGRRRFAMRRIYHRIHRLVGRRDMRELDALAAKGREEEPPE